MTVDPLAFLGDEVAGLRSQHLYRDLRVLTSAQGPVVEPGNSRITVLVHSGGLSQLFRSSFNSFAAAAMAACWSAFGSGKGNVSKQVVGV